MDIKVSIKAMGKLFWIPIIVNDILIPCVMFLLSVKCKHDVLIDAGMLLIQMFTPFLAAFWIFIHLMKYIEEKGNASITVPVTSYACTVIILFFPTGIFSIKK